LPAAAAHFIAVLLPFRIVDTCFGRITIISSLIGLLSRHVKPHEAALYYFAAIFRTPVIDFGARLIPASMLPRRF
jgi:hypothetical protein